MPEKLTRKRAFWDVRKSKWRTHKDESTDAEHRGGLPRISDEASVMEVERRG
jgi:RNA-directed DNA polymerase